MNKTVVGQNIRLNNFGIVKEDVVPSDTNPNFGVVQSPNDLAISKIVGISNFVQCVSPVDSISY